MSQPLTRKSLDRSDKERFLFSFYCDRCGKEWTSHPVSFNTGGFSAIEHEEAGLLVWTYEHKTAFEHANLDARMKFNLCLKCGRWVCGECFNAENSLCKVCLRKL